jgi:hypothetical protein
MGPQDPAMLGMILQAKFDTPVLNGFTVRPAVSDEDYLTGDRGGREFFSAGVIRKGGVVG